MIRFLTDEDFRWAIFNGIRLRLTDLDIVRVQVPAFVLSAMH